MEKLTKRSVYEALLKMVETGTLEITEDELKTFCENEIALLDKKAEKAKERAATKRAEGDALTDAVRGALTGEFESIADIAARIEGEDVTVSKVQYRLTQLVKAGEAEKDQITVPATETTKARKIMGYRIASAEVAE